MHGHMRAVPALLSFGHGYTARALTRRLLARGWRVIGTSRTDEGRDAIAATGAEGVVWPGPDIDAALAASTHLLSSVPPDEAGDPVLAALPDIGTRPWRWAGYLSTTGVYGDHGGAWVDETTPPSPASARGRARLAAETAWQASGAPSHVFRLAGIYGPGRGPFEKVRMGTARRILKPGQVFSRIHVEDIATVLEASIAAPAPGAIYNVCDDDPAPPEDVLAFAAELLGLPPPPAVPFDDAELSPMARSFYAENKRVRNDRIHALGVRLRYPTYREGLAAILRDPA